MNDKQCDLHLTQLCIHNNSKKKADRYLINNILSRKMNYIFRQNIRLTHYLTLIRCSSIFGRFLRLVCNTTFTNLTRSETTQITAKKEILSTHMNDSYINQLVKQHTHSTETADSPNCINIVYLFSHCPEQILIESETMKKLQDSNNYQGDGQPRILFIM